MYTNRTPTNSELLMSALGFIAVIAAAISLATAAILLYTSGPRPDLGWLIAASVVVLFAGWEAQNQAQRLGSDYPSLMILMSLSAGVCAFGGYGGHLLVASLGAIVAICFAPVCTLTILGNLKIWRQAEGNTSGKRSVEPVIIVAGVVRPQADNYGRKFRVAEEIFDNAQLNSQYSYRGPAQRAPVQWHFDRSGASSDTLALLRNSLDRQPRREWDIFVMMVSALPDESEQPAVIVVADDDLQSLVVDDEAITLKTAGFAGKIPAASIRGLVCYKW